MKNLVTVDNSTVAEFQRQVSEFLDAVVKQEGPNFVKHLREDIFLYSILPFEGGKQITSYHEYLQFHSWWMQMRDRRWNYVIDRITFLTNDIASVTITANYRYSEEARNVIRVITIVDVFKLQDGVWYMATSQNTLVSEKTF